MSIKEQLKQINEKMYLGNYALLSETVQLLCDYVLPQADDKFKHLVESWRRIQIGQAPDAEVKANFEVVLIYAALTDRLPDEDEIKRMVVDHIMKKFLDGKD